jgi:hypothetical protein
MFQTILLSLKRIPLPIFFNNGPRHREDEHHHNRWIPTKIGDYGIASSHQALTIQPTYIEYIHSHQDTDQEITIYTSPSIIQLVKETSLSLEDTGAIYTVHPLVPANDRFDMSMFEFTCVIVDKRNSARHNDHLRGAFFFVEARRPPTCGGKDHFLRRLITCLTRTKQQPHWYMTYYCPITLQRTEADEANTVGAGPIHSLEPLKNSCSLRIRYGKPLLEI